jgi:BMFP domain-containing protein YqiC
LQSENRIFDDLVKFVNGAAGTIAGVGRETESSARARVRDWIGGLDFMAAAASDENDVLKARLDAIEARMGPQA